MTRERTLSIVIPNYNGASVLHRCLDALDGQTAQADEVIVVDNGSTDGSAQAATRGRSLSLISLSDNRGFGAAANVGVRACSAEAVAVLNSDARPSAGWVERMKQFHRDGAWSWGGVLLDTAGAVESAGDCYSYAGHSYKALRGADRGQLPSAPYEVFAVPGAAVVVDRDAFLELGGYREDLFLYYEDIDLAFRAHYAGYTAWVLPDVFVEHDLAGSSSRRRATYFIARNAVDCYVRHTPELHARQLLATTRRELRAARRNGVAGAYVRGRASAVARLPRSLLGRRRTAEARGAGVDAATCALLPPTATGVGS
ncbi:MAG TPA: glycosyltransferase family 2 protein [Mycobacteriales bacterium]|nr:glycosyltransferase family 2 protein [Mycobacteriales bacterium]